jgi:hypothetical protein
LSSAKTTEICENLTQDISNELTFNSAAIREGRYSRVSSVDKLSNEEELERIVKRLFECQIEPRYGKKVLEYESECIPFTTFPRFISLIFCKSCFWKAKLDENKEP